MKITNPKQFFFGEAVKAFSDVLACYELGDERRQGVLLAARALATRMSEACPKHWGWQPRNFLCCIADREHSERAHVRSLDATAPACSHMGCNTPAKFKEMRRTVTPQGRVCLAFYPVCFEHLDKNTTQWSLIESRKGGAA